jgi:hypothetical protein
MGAVPGLTQDDVVAVWSKPIDRFQEQGEA